MQHLHYTVLDLIMVPLISTSLYFNRSMLNIRDIKLSDIVNITMILMLFIQPLSFQ